MPTNNNVIIPEGAFLLARKAFEHELWTEKPATWWKIWCYILGHVQHVEHNKLGRGQGYFNFSRLCEMHAFGDDITINHVEKFLKYAKDQRMVSSIKATHGAVLTVINYDLYQTLNNYSTEPSGAVSGGSSGTDLAIEASVAPDDGAEQQAELPAEAEAEQKRNRSGNINKYDKYDKYDRPSLLAGNKGLSHEQAWDQYSPMCLKQYDMTDEQAIAGIRGKFLTKARSATPGAVEGFIRQGQDDYRKAVDARQAQLRRPSDDLIYPNITQRRLAAMQKQGGSL